MDFSLLYIRYGPTPESEPEEPDASHQPPVRSLKDPTLLKDDRVLRNLLRLESRSLPSAPDYFKFVQGPQLTEDMRKIVTEWMLQVCEELQRAPEVFSLAVNYLDRFLGRCKVGKSRLQLLGSVCLMIASKFKETNPIQGERLIYFSDFSIRPDELKVSPDYSHGPFMM